MGANKNYLREMSQNSENEQLEHNTLINQAGETGTSMKADILKTFEKREKSSQPETCVDMKGEGSQFSSDSTIEKPDKPDKHRRFLCFTFSTSMLVAAVTSAIIVVTYFMIYLPKTNLDQVPTTNTTSDTGFPKTDMLRYTGHDTKESSNVFAQFNIDQLSLKDQRQIVWVNRERGVPSEAFATDDNGCVLVKMSGVYVLVSKVTFVYKKISPIASLFHAVILKKMNETGDVLENNSLQLPKKVYRPTRVTQASTITSLQTIQAGEAICIGVTDAKWLYISSSANTLKIFRLSS